MTDNHPITVPAGSITVWKTLYREAYQGDLSETEYVVTQAARWGADQELEACCEWLSDRSSLTERLRAARRPKPPSLKEQALEQLKSLEVAFLASHGGNAKTESIRRALEQLND